MFTEFTPVRGSFWKQRVNTWVGIVFVCTVALWAGMFMLNIENGTNPVSENIASAIAHETQLPQ